MGETRDGIRRFRVLRLSLRLGLHLRPSDHLFDPFLLMTSLPYHSLPGILIPSSRISIPICAHFPSATDTQMHRPFAACVSPFTAMQITRSDALHPDCGLYHDPRICQPHLRPPGTQAGE